MAGSTTASALYSNWPILSSLMVCGAAPNTALLVAANRRWAAHLGSEYSGETLVPSGSCAYRCCILTRSSLTGADCCCCCRWDLQCQPAAVLHMLLLQHSTAALQSSPACCLFHLRVCAQSHQAGSQQQLVRHTKYSSCIYADSMFSIFWTPLCANEHAAAIVRVQCAAGSS